MFFKADITRNQSSLEIVQSFVNTHYPDLRLDQEMMDQLLWLQDNSINTSQSNPQLKKDTVNIEVKRILSRLYCLRLFENGDKTSYQMFIQSQPEDNVLSEDHFFRLSRFIQQLSPASRQCLMATCFITKSDKAMMAIPTDLRSAVPADSEQFITHVVTHFPAIFPISNMLTPEAIHLLPYAFYKNAHARQMLDMEGGYNMVSSITEGIRTGAITLEQFNLWFARWIINIAGLDGHVDHRGSIYLTESVANCIFSLKFGLDMLWSNPQYSVLDHYLVFRAEQLSVSSNYIAYLGALMRQHHPSKGHEIQAWFDSLGEHKQQERLQAFTQQLQQTRVTPTFKPTVLVNLLALGCSVSDALTIFTEIESSAMQTYYTAVSEGHLSDTTPLSFRNVAFKETLSPIIEYYKEHNCLPEMEIDIGGYLQVTPQALQNRVSFSI